jgi:hypothetical protein
MPAFEVLVRVNAGDPTCRVVVIARNEDAAIQIVFDNRVACDSDHEIRIQNLVGSNYEKHPDGTLLIGFETADKESDSKVRKQPKPYAKLARAQPKKSLVTPASHRR